MSSGRVTPQQARLLAILKDGKWHSARDLVIDGWCQSYTRRIHELRGLGFEIDGPRRVPGIRTTYYRLHNDRTLDGEA